MKTAVGTCTFIPVISSDTRVLGGMGEDDAYDAQCGQETTSTRRSVCWQRTKTLFHFYDNRHILIRSLQLLRSMNLHLGSKEQKRVTKVSKDGFSLQHHTVSRVSPKAPAPLIYNQYYILSEFMLTLLAMVPSWQ